MFSSFDVKIIIDELKNEYNIVGMKVDKVYKIGDEVRIKLYGRGRKDLVLKPGTALFATSYPKPAPQHPAGFAMQLRKHLGGLRILGIEQVGFDRIAKIEFGLFGEENLTKYYVILELFGDGNLILTDDKLTIIGALSQKVWSTRSVTTRERYAPPPAMSSPYEVDLEELIDGETEIVRRLANTMNIGGIYAEEICLRAGIDKRDHSPDPDKVREGIRTLLALPPSPAIVNGDVVPFDLLVHEGKERQAFSTLNEAADELYGKHELEQIAKKEVSKKEKQLNKLERILTTQQRTVEDYEKKSEQAQQKGNLLFAHYQFVDELIKRFYAAIKEKGWDATRSRVNAEERLSSIVKRMNEHEGTIIVELDGEEVELDITCSLNENAQRYYERAKKFKHKMKGARSAIERTQQSIEHTQKEDVAVESVEKKQRRKREWYERYRWFVSSEGHLVIGGRDARSNESIVKRHLEEGDIHVHADMTGAPQVIVKEGANASEDVLHEAGIFAVSFSKAWKMQVGGLDAYWVHPEQVTKDAPSGEFLTTGAFAIKGKKNYLKKLPLEVAIGIYKDKVMCGPITAVEKNCETNVRVVPGPRSKEDVAKRLQKMLEWDDLDEVVQALPPGTCTIVGK